LLDLFVPRLFRTAQRDPDMEGGWGTRSLGCVARLPAPPPGASSGCWTSSWRFALPHSVAPLLRPDRGRRCDGRAAPASSSASSGVGLDGHVLADEFRSLRPAGEGESRTRWSSPTTPAGTGRQVSGAVHPLTSFRIRNVLGRHDARRAEARNARITWNSSPAVPRLPRGRHRVPGASTGWAQVHGLRATRRSPAGAIRPTLRAELVAVARRADLLRPCWPYSSAKAADPLSTTTRR